ncbi:MAG TPA: hypothetical protein DER64_11760, partial [Planctomycetaceae bacterium]|nr:hypothetical protein [Planctomycetaceae bacterium]
MRVVETIVLWMRWSVAAAVVAVLLLAGDPAVAQDEIRRAGGQSPRVEPIAGPPAAKDEKFEQWIYVPYRDLKSVFDKHPSAVFLPYMEYLRLWERAGRADRVAKGPPVSGVITQADYVATVDENLARITATLSVQVLGKSWSEIPIRFGQAAIGKVTAIRNGKATQVLLRGTGAGQYALLFPEPGTHAVTLELTARIRASADGHSFDFDCPTVGMTTFELTVPRPEQAVDLTPRLVALPVKTDKGRTRVRARLGATPKISALWYPRVGQKPDMDLLTSVSNYQHVSVRDGLVHTDVFLHHEVLRGELTQLRIAVPLGHRILDVASTQAKIRKWVPVNEEKRQVVTVEFIGSVQGKFVLEVHTERPAPAMGQVFAVSGVDTAGIEKSTIDDPGMMIHGIHSLDAVRESGQVVLTHGADLTLNVAPPRGLVRIEPNEVFQAIRRPAGRSYKYFSPRFDLRVSYEPVQPRITVDHATRLIFRDDELRSVSQLKYTVERAGVFEWKLKLPAGLEFDGVTGTAYKEHSFDKASRILTVVLAQRRQGALSLVIKAHQAFDGEAETVDVSLPVIEPLGVVREDGSILVYAPDAFEVITDEEKLSGIQPNRGGQLGAKIGRARLASAWQYTSYPSVDAARLLALPVTTRRRPTRLSATVATTANAKQQLVEVDSKVIFTVEYAGTDTFRIRVPESIGQDPQITTTTAPGGASRPVPIREKIAGEPEDGWVTWTIVMQQELTGPVAFVVSWDLKTGDGGGEGDDDEDEQSAASNQVQVQPPVALDLDNDNITGELVIRKDDALEVKWPDDGQLEGLEFIDVRELKLLPTSGSVAFRFHVQPVSLEISTRKFESEKVVQTVVSRALVEMVINKNGTASVRARYRLKSSERQRLRVDLPGESNVSEIFVDQGRVPVEKAGDDQEAPEGWTAYSLNVAGTTTDEEFFLSIRYDLPQDSFFDNWFGSSESIKLPQVGGVESDEREVVTQELRTAVFVPEEYKLVGVPKHFVILSTPHDRLEHWFDDKKHTSNLGYLPLQGRSIVYGNLGGAESLAATWWETSSMAAGISVPIFAIGCVLLWTPWSNRLSVVLIATFIVSLMSLSYADSVSEALLAGRWGIGFGVAAWMLASVVGFQHSSGLSSLLLKVTAKSSAEPDDDKSESGEESGEESG